MHGFHGLDCMDYQAFVSKKNIEEHGHRIRKNQLTWLHEHAGRICGFEEVSKLSLGRRFLKGGDLNCFIFDAKSDTWQSSEP